MRGTPEVESRSPEAEDLQAELTDPGRVLGSPRAAPYLQKQGSGVSQPPRPWLCLLGQGHYQGQTAQLALPRVSLVQRLDWTPWARAQLSLASGLSTFLKRVGNF